MKLAKDFRESARKALKGNWVIAIAAGVIALIFGIGGGAGASFNTDIGENADTEGVGELSNIVEEYFPLFLGILAFVLFFALIFGLAWSAVASTVNLGYCRFNLDLIDGKPLSVGTMFSYFPHFWKAFASEFLRTLYAFLWSLLFIIPGIIAAYNYALVPYIIAEDTSISVSEALRKSKQLMNGNRWRLFCLECSFIGWHLLGAVTFGISILWVIPYQNAATADFYREISGTRPVISFEGGEDLAEITEQPAEF